MTSLHMLAFHLVCVSLIIVLAVRVYEAEISFTAARWLVRNRVQYRSVILKHHFMHNDTGSPCNKYGGY